ncbi:MAG: glycosyl transferase [Candidatus Tectimicrobiota bacterium]|nr:MAG: glycosyl transferase [Candidatus Tectomicrobia bacterium]
MEVLFWLCVGLMAYAYFGYPLALLGLRLWRRQPVRKADITPAVSLLIAAYNEEKDMRAKLDNALSLDYPQEKLQIIVASDCSTDKTDAIVQEYAARGVQLVRLPQRGGKTAALNAAVPHARGEILVFSDAATFYRADALRKLVRSFADPGVGCVSGDIIYTNDVQTLVGNGGSLYWRYERWLRQLESDLGSVVGMAGCMYALRRALFRPLGIETPPGKRSLSQSLDDDFLTPLRLRLEGGYRAVMESEALCYEKVAGGCREEFRMRRRVIARAITGLLYMRAVLNPLRFPLYAWQLVSHKVLRWLGPLWLLGALFSSAALAAQPLYRGLLAAQLGFYLCAVAGYLSEQQRLRTGRWLSVPLYFCVSNLAALAALGKVLGGRPDGVWTPIRR